MPTCQQDVIYKASKLFFFFVPVLQFVAMRGKSLVDRVVNEQVSHLNPNTFYLVILFILYFFVLFQICFRRGSLQARSCQMHLSGVSKFFM